MTTSLTMTRASGLAAAAALGLVLTGGMAYAADGTPQPAPTASAPATTGVDGSTLPPGTLVPAPVTAPGDSEPQAPGAGDGVAVASYVQPKQRAFGFTFSGLRQSDVVTVTWRSVLNPRGVTSTNVYRGGDPTAGWGGWYSGHQTGWTDAFVTVTRDGEVVLTQAIANTRAVTITPRSTARSFTFAVRRAQAGDRMRVDWTMRDGTTGSYEGPASTFTHTRLPRWATATVRVYEGSNPLNLLAPVVTITSPAVDASPAAPAMPPTEG